MTKTIIFSCAVTFTLSLVLVYGQSDEILPTRLTPEEVPWNVATGVGVADLAGDDQTPGMYAYRVRFPDGFMNQPHFHPDDRIVTVISGTLHMGYGDTFDESALKSLPQGSVWTEPGNTPHFVAARDGEVVIQVIGNGPSATIQVVADP